MGKEKLPRRSKKLPAPYQKVDEILQMHREHEDLDASKRNCLYCAPTLDAVSLALPEVKQEPEPRAAKRPRGSKQRLTERRIVIIKAFLTKSLKHPHNYDPVRSPKWIKTITQFLGDEKITKTDILTWLSTPRFQPLVDQIGKLFQEPEAKRNCLCCVAVPVAPQQPWFNALGLVCVAPIEPVSLEPYSEPNGQQVEENSFGTSDVKEMLYVLISIAGRRLGESTDFNEARKWGLFLNIFHALLYFLS